MPHEPHFVPSVKRVLKRDQLAKTALAFAALMLLLPLVAAVDALDTPASAFLIAAAILCPPLVALAVLRVRAVRETFRHGEYCRGLVREVSVRRHSGRYGTSTRCVLYFAYRLDDETTERRTPISHHDLWLRDVSHIDVVADPKRRRRAFVVDLFA